MLIARYIVACTAPSQSHYCSLYVFRICDDIELFGVATRLNELHFSTLFLLERGEPSRCPVLQHLSLTGVGLRGFNSCFVVPPAAPPPTRQMPR
jgi:hypothetical protein